MKVEPLTIEKAMQITGLSRDQIVISFNRMFGSYENYVRMCEEKSVLDRRIGQLERRIVEIDGLQVMLPPHEEN